MKISFLMILMSNFFLPYCASLSFFFHEYTVCNLYSYMLFGTSIIFYAYWMRTLFSFVTLMHGVMNFWMYAYVVSYIGIISVKELGMYKMN